MIDAQDIIELAGELSLDPSGVEKDYVLGWLSPPSRSTERTLVRLGFN